MQTDAQPLLSPLSTVQVVEVEEGAVMEGPLTEVSGTSEARHWLLEVMTHPLTHSHAPLFLVRVCVLHVRGAHPDPAAVRCRRERCGAGGLEEEEGEGQGGAVYLPCMHAVPST